MYLLWPNNIKHRAPSRYENVIVEITITSVVFLLYISNKSICSKSVVKFGFTHWQRYPKWTTFEQLRFRREKSKNKSQERIDYEDGVWFTTGLPSQAEESGQLEAEEIRCEGTFDCVKKCWVIWEQNQQVNGLL